MTPPQRLKKSFKLGTAVIIGMATLVNGWLIYVFFLGLKEFFK